MSFNTSALSAYVDENKNELIASSVAGAPSVELFPLQTGIKSGAPINIFDTDVVLQDGSPASAGRTPNGTTTFSQRSLNVASIKVEEDMDVKKLEAFYTQHEVKAGSYTDELPFEQVWSERKAEKIASALEIAIWQGEEGGAGGANLDKFDGFLHIIADETASVVHANGASGGVLTGTGITRANILSIVDTTIESIPDAIYGKDDVAVLMGKDKFRMFLMALKDANLYHVPAEGFRSFELEYGGVKVIALDGLTAVADDASPIVAGRISNFVIGTDLEDDRMELWYSKDDKVVKFDAEFKMGVNLAFPSEVVEFSTNAS